MIFQSEKPGLCRESIRGTYDELWSETEIWLGALDINLKTEFRTSRVYKHLSTQRSPREIYASFKLTNLGLERSLFDK